MAAVALAGDTPVYAQAKCLASGCMAWNFNSKDPTGKDGDCALKREPT
jgi:hypothetical protein